jgi:hypothetical protein
MKTLTFIADDKAAAINGGLKVRNTTTFSQVAKRGSRDALLIQNAGSSGNALLAIGGVQVF